jgi:nitrous oxidase accessory protein NosD
MTECTAQIAAGADLSAAIAAAPEGATLCLAPGSYSGCLRIERSLTLRGPGAILDAGQEGRVLLLPVDGARVLLEGLTLRGGSAKEGGGVAIEAFAELTLRDCRLEGNRARGAGGGALYASMGKVVLERCTLADNQAEAGQALFANQVARLEARSCVLSGAGTGSLVLARDGARIEFEGCRLDAPLVLEASGTSSRAPELRLVACTLGGRIQNDPVRPARIHIDTP